MITSSAVRQYIGAFVAFGLSLGFLGAAAPTDGWMPATVHDDLASANPGDGDTVTAVPDTLRLTFTRAQNLDLASVELTGPGGAVSLGALRAHADSSAVVLVPAEGPWTAGPHTVRWRIVGQDGHPVSGDYTFVVTAEAAGLDRAEPRSGSDTVPSPGAEASGTALPSAGDGGDGAATDEGSFGVGSPLYVVVRWLTFAGLLGVVGAASWTLLVLPLAHGRDGGVDVAVERQASMALAAWSAGLVLVAGFVRLWAQAEVLGDGSVVRAMLGSTAWGAGWWIQIGASVVALGALAWARKSPRASLPWIIVGASALALSFTPALSGHALADGVGSWTFLADGAHILSAGGWMGGLLFLIVAAVPRAVRGDSVPLPSLVEAFSITALAFATLLVGTGLFAAWQHLGSVEALWTAEYGRVLGLKLLVLLPLLATGAYNWRRVRPALARGESGAPDLRRSGSVELLVAVVVLLVTAVLVATPPPGETHDTGSSAMSTSTQARE